VTFSGEQAHNVTVMMIGCELLDARDERLRIADRLGAVGRQAEFQRFGCAALPPNVQPDDLRFRSLGYRHVTN